MQSEAPDGEIRAAEPPGTAAESFYRHVLQTLQAGGVPFLVGGAYAFAAYTGIQRSTKDLDLFIRHADLPRAASVLTAAGYEVRDTHPHWLAKTHAGADFVDLIHGAGNGIAVVDDEWFEHAVPATLLGVQAGLTPVEESIWSKAFIMERERYDGADIAHLLLARAETIDWHRLLRRFGVHWRVLLAHLVLFGFVYPDERARLPSKLIDRMLEQLRREGRSAPPRSGVCAGTLLSREQYLEDVENRGLRDGREVPYGNMTADDIAEWTQSIPAKRRPHGAGDSPPG